MAGLQLVIRYHLDYEDQALALARRLFAQYDEAIHTLVLAPIESGEDEFSLALNGRVVHSQRVTGRPPQVTHVRAALSELPN